MVSEAAAPAQGPVLTHAVSLEKQAADVEGCLEFGDAERASLAAFLKIERLDRLTFKYHIAPLEEDRFHLTAELSAELVQLCVVTLDPVAERLHEAVSLECWPQDQIEALARDAKAIGPDALPEDPPVPILDGQVDLGALAAEILASAINPYPRKDAAAFDWQDPKLAETGRPDGPFASLEKLKSKD